MAEVVLENVSRQFSADATAVDRLTLTAQDKEFLVLVGPSGCGKTTTLRMIAGLEEVSAGTIRIGGRDVTRIPPRDRDVAMVFQNYALYPHLNVRRNMSFGLELRYGGGWLSRAARRLLQPRRAATLEPKRREIPKKVATAAESLEIAHLLDRMPRELSGGERQRVALGRAIVREPAVFLFDEPLSNLDAKLRVEMRKELKQLHQRLAATMIYVTHDQVEALTLGQRIAVMRRGRLQQVGTPEEVYDRPRNRFVAGFLGNPAMNFLPARLEADEGELVCRLAEARLVLAPPADGSRLEEFVGRLVWLGIRPEDVSPAEDGAAQERLEGTVAVVESLGDATLAYFELKVPESRDILHATGGDGAKKGEAADNLPQTATTSEVQSARITLIGKIHGRTGLTPGAPVRIALRQERLQVFDPESGDNLLQS